MAEDILSQVSTSSVKNTYNKYLAKIPKGNLESNEVSTNSSLDVKKIRNVVISNRKNSEFVPNITKVVENIIETGKKIEAASNGIMCKKPIISTLSRKAIANEFVPFNLLKDDSIESAKAEIQIEDMFEDSSFELPANVNKFESQWGCDTQLAELMDNADAYLNLVNSKEMTQAHGFEKKEKSNSEIALTRNTCPKKENDCKTTCSNVEKFGSSNFESMNSEKNKTSIDSTKTLSNIDNEDITNGKTWDENSIFKVPTHIKKRKCFSEDSQDISFSKPSGSFSGFQTASNRIIHLSEKALGHVKDIFKDIDLDALDSKHFNISTTSNSLEVKHRKDFLRNDNVMDVKFSSFKTTSDKNIEISKSSINKAKIILETCNEDNNINTSNVTVNHTGDDICFQSQDFTNNQFIVNESAGFKTVSEKPIVISKEYVLRAKKIFDDITIPNIPDNVSNIQEGFDSYNLEKERESNDSLKMISKLQNQSSKEILTDTVSHICAQDRESLRLNETYIIDKKQLDEIQGKVVDLQSWESFFDKTFESSNNSNTSSTKDIENKDTMNIDSDDENISCSPVIVSQRYKEKPVMQNKNCTETVKKIVLECVNLSSINDENKQLKPKNESHNINLCQLKDHNICSTKNNNQKITGEKCTASNEHSGSKILGKKEKMIEESYYSSSKKCFPGFKTANNKDISVSKKALLAAKNKFSDIENTSDSNLILPEKFSNEICLDKCSSSEILEKQEQLVDFSSLQNKNYVGFKTANNKEISLPEKALKAAKNIFSDIENMSSCDTNSNLQENFSSEINVDKQSGLEILEKEQKIDDFSPLSPKKCFPGFKTANNKEISVSEISLKAAKSIFGDIKNIDMMDSKLHENISTNALVNKHSHLGLLQKQEQNNDATFDSLQNKCLSGFKTASNKDISLSEKALMAAKNIFSDIETKNVIDSKQCDVFSSEEAIDLISHLDILENQDKLSDYSSLQNKNFPSFKTANNKEVSISEKALQTAKNIFSDIENINSIHSNSKLPKTSSEMNVDKQSEISGKENQKIDVSSPWLPKKCFPGFTTANNKEISVSENALKVAKNLFNDIENTNGSTSDKHSNSSVLGTEEQKIDMSSHWSPKKSFPGFKTAKNDDIYVSEKSLKAVKSIFSDIDSHTLPKICSGFKTANNKNISISEDCLSKTKNLFDDITNTSECAIKLEKELFGITQSSNTFKGTADNKVILTSETALIKTCASFQSVEKHLNYEEILPEDSIATLQLPDSYSQMNNITQSKNVQKKDVDIIESTSSSYSKNLPSKLGKESLLDQFNDDFSVEKHNPTVKNNCININEESLFKLDYSESVNMRKTKQSSIDANQIQNVAMLSNKQVIASLKSLASEQVDNFDTKHEKLEIRKNPNKRKRNTPILENCQEMTKDDHELTFPHIGLTQEISESTMALLTDEKKTNEKVCEDEDMVESPSSPIIQSKVKCSKTFRVPYKTISSKTYASTDKVDAECHIIKKRKIESQLNNLNIKRNLDSNKQKDLNLGNLLFSKTNRGVNKTSIFSLRQICKTDFTSIPEDIVNVTPENFEEFIFTNERIDIDVDKNTIKTVDIKQISQYFLEHKDIDKKLIPDGWVLNHVKWIMWKLASYERFLKYQYEKILTVGNVLKQLKYRYDRELYKAERPIIRKILECDDIPSRRMVICVSRIIKLSENEGESSKLQCYESKYEMEVTDGWYSVIASIDGLLSQAIMTGKIVCGCKIVTCGAELLNCTDGKSPLEDISGVRLRLHGNSTRIAPPDSKLGLCQDCGPLRIKTESLKARSGSVPVLRIAPVIVYPQLYVEKLPNGDTITRSEKLEQVHSSSLDMDFQVKIEKIYSQVEREVSDTETLEKSKKKMHIMRGRLHRNLEEKTGEELMDMLNEANDPVDFMNSLSGSQKSNLENAVLEKQIRKRGIIDNRVKDMLNEQGLGVNRRKVVSILKVRGVALEVMKEGKYNTTPVMLTIWKVDDNILHILQHSQLLDVFRAIPTGFRMGELHLSTCKQTIFSEITNTSFLDKFPNLYKYQRKCTPIKELNYSGFAPMFNEADTVGLVFHIEPSAMQQTSLPNSKDNVHLSPNMQTAYLTDDQMNFLAIHFWGGIFKFGYEKIIEIGKILACSNLQHRPRTSRKRFRNLYATEYSTFTQCPRKKYMEQDMKKLEELFKTINVKIYIENCKKKLIEIKSTPWIHNNNRNCNSAIQNNSTNLSGVFNNRSLQNYKPLSVSNVSHQSNNEIDENSLSGLDFESTFNESSVQRFNNSTPKTSKFPNDQSTLQRSPTEAEKRIKRLKMYGEPPPISPIVFNVSKNLKKDFLLPRLDLSSTSLNNSSASLDCNKRDRGVLSECKRNNKDIDNCVNNVQDT